jgi:hypothetical protein
VSGRDLGKEHVLEVAVVEFVEAEDTMVKFVQTTGSVLAASLWQPQFS